jgi:protein-tyrosine phosphatase
MNNPRCLCICLFLLLATLARADYYLPERTRFITASHSPDDVRGRPVISNFLFRGNMPLTRGALCAPNQKFDFEMLAKTLQDRMVEPYVLHSNFSVLDISLVTAKTACPDRHDLDAELKFAEQHPQLVEVLNWVLLGNKASPMTVEPGRRKVLAQNLPLWQEDRLPQRVERLHELMMLQQDRQLVLYVHCEQGQDRTGEIIGSYMMRYMGMKWPEIREYNIKVTGHGPIPKHFNALMWYCLYLESQGLDMQCSA